MITPERIAELRKLTEKYYEPRLAYATSSVQSLASSIVELLDEVERLRVEVKAAYRLAGKGAEYAYSNAEDAIKAEGDAVALRAALAFYADAKSYYYSPYPDDTPAPVTVDRGERARAALGRGKAGEG